MYFFLVSLPFFPSFFFPLYVLTTMLSATNDKPSNTYIENTFKIQTIPGTKFVTLLASAQSLHVHVHTFTPSVPTRHATIK